MKGMTLKEFQEVVDFSQKYHAFALWLTDEQVKERNKKYFQMHGAFGAHGMNIKYIDTIYDSRDQTIWSITFRQGKYGWRFSTNHYTALNPPPKNFKYGTLYDLCMAFLKGEFKPKKEFEVDLDG
jgi:hypothetical protein